MEFIKTADSKTAIHAVTKRLQKELKDGKRVLWLVCGGSGIAAEAQVLKALQKNGSTENLAIMLMDERFGPVGHSDSNWQQLLDAGCDFTGMYAMPAITNPEKPLKQTVADYAKLTKVALDAADVIVGQFGVGADGHTAGMLPNSPAVKKTVARVVSYESPPFTRITLTRQALNKVDAAYVFAFGNTKRGALMDLRANKKSFERLPSKIFWELPEAYVYNDQIGDN